MWFTYIILCKDNSLYTGITQNLKIRFETHSAGRGGRYTRSHKPLKLIYSEKFVTKELALKRECQIKGWQREKKLNLIRFSKPVI